MNSVIDEEIRDTVCRGLYLPGMQQDVEFRTFDASHL